MRSWYWLLVPLFSGLGCRSQTHVVPTGPHPSGAPEVRVEAPPPPARVEIIPLARHGGCAWLDGHYERRGRSWQWKKGRWVRPPAGCYYARSVTRYEETPKGVLLIHRPGGWYPKRDDQTCEVVRSCDIPDASPREEGESAASTTPGETDGSL